jgi:hypothetical protein
MRRVIFEARSNLHHLESRAFFKCSSLSSICIPKRVEVPGVMCFSNYGRLPVVIFEAPSKLSEIEPNLFHDCPSVSAFCIPASVNWTYPGAFSREGSLKIKLEAGSRSFVVRNHFLLDVGEASLVMYLGTQSIVVIPRGVQWICASAFWNCGSICSIVFEQHSVLTALESEAFSG